jgi:hypothetical protein
VDDLVVLIENPLVLGCVIAFGLWALRRVGRDQRRDRE